MCLRSLEFYKELNTISYIFLNPDFFGFFSYLLILNLQNLLSNL